MISPRNYRCALKFNGNSIIDFRPTNTWTKNGTLDFSGESRYNNLKYEIRNCMSYTFAKTGYITETTGSLNISKEYTLSLWFKIDQEIFTYFSLFQSFKPVRLVTWGANSEYYINALTYTGNDKYDFAFEFVSPTNRLTVPYDFYSYMGEWIHLLVSREDTKNLGLVSRVFINGIKYVESNDLLSHMGTDMFSEIKFGEVEDDPNVVHSVPIHIHMDEIVLANTCLIIEHFYPYPKYLTGFYPPTEIKDWKKRQLPAGKTKYDIVNDAILITRPVYYRPPIGWEEDMYTKYRFDRQEPFASSYFDKWMDNREHPGIEYRKSK